jgi:class 3 adenylate cyclase/tetratricopeptide (TPR) repeat protein
MPRMAPAGATTRRRPRPQDRSAELLKPFVPRLLIDWLRETPLAPYREVEGSLAFVDISGFTTLTERLALKGKVGAEELDDILNAIFEGLLSVASDDGASLIKWGGDAVLLLFDGNGHAARACRAAWGMQRTIRRIGRLRTSAGAVRLRMSVGIHSGTFHFFLAGDLHRELVIAGPAATITARMESIAEAGEVAISPATAALLDPEVVGEPKAEAFLLAAEPDGEPGWVRPEPDAAGVDLAACLPIGIREYLLHGSPEPEHRYISVAFIEFSGTDAILAGSGPGAVADAVDECISNVQLAAHRYGVTFFLTDINENGGKILLVAGAPTSIGSSEERMLRTVRTIMDGGGIVPLRIGVNGGYVFAAGFGPPYRRTYSVKGDAVNLAARLMGAAGRGQILATDAVLSRSATTFETEQLEPFHVKGKSEPVQALSVGAIAGSRGVVHGETPLVGREREMAVLQEALDSARARRGRVVELIGEPGIGKSRLVDELRARANGVTVLTVACEEYESSTPYFPIRLLLRDLLGVADGTDPAQVAGQLRARIEPNAPDLVPWLPLLGVPMDFWMEPTPQTAQLEEQFRKARVEQVTAEFLSWVLPNPTLFVFEDVHWMDDASAELLRRLSACVERAPWLILVTRREGDAGFTASGPSTVSLRPEPLGPTDAAALLAASSGDDPLSRNELAGLAARAGGNPLFLKELLLAARSTGSVEGLPGSIEGLVAAQIDRLAPGDRTVLRYASVLGMSFETDLLREVLEAERLPVRTPLRRLANFLRREGPRRLQFQHALIRDAAYEGLAYRRRRSLHGRVGEAMELRAGDRPEDQAELLSLHFFHAQRYDKAWRYSRLAGDRARDKYANVEAADFYRRALEAGRRVPGVSVAQVARVTEALGDVRNRAGMFEEAARAYREARRLERGDPTIRANLLLKQAWIPERLGRYPQALGLVSRATHVLEGVPGDAAASLRAQLSVWYAAVRQQQGRHEEAIAWCRRAIELAQAAQDRDALAHAYYVLDWGLVQVGRAEEARYSPLALAIYEELGNLGGQAVVSNNMGVLAYYEGRWNDARDLYERGREAREMTGDPVEAAGGWFNIAEILSDQGDQQAAEPLLRDVLRVWKGAGMRSGIALATSQLGRVAYRSGRFEEAASLLGDARAIYQELGGEAGVLDSDARIAESLIFRASWEPALSLVQKTLERSVALGVTIHCPLLHRVRGYAFMQAGRLEDARAALEESLRLGRLARANHETGWTLEALARLDRLEGRRPAEAIRDETRAIFAGLGVIATPVVPLLA